MNASELFDLSGKVALITGSTKGIGKAIAKTFASAGAKVVVSSRKDERCRAVAAEICADGGEAIGIPCNISDKEQLQALVNATLKAWGHIDILVCNAAVNPYFGPLAGITQEAYDKIMDVNIGSNLWLCNMVLPQMAERKDGAVIIVSSIGGLKGSENLGAYGISKAADMQLARNLAVEWGHANIRANCIAPGLVKTDFARALWEDPEATKRALAAYPIGRLGEPEDIAGAALFLAGKAGSFVSGHTLVVDGGSTIGSSRYS
ncbi:SDR family oxidoreductase [Thalassospiraceae bacterium LMO-JJ14]|nr:SDR family oxidoreductase [Thalassospiraceae bacterium LMO-JJ14]